MAERSRTYSVIDAGRSTVDDLVTHQDIAGLVMIRPETLSLSGR